MAKIKIVKKENNLEQTMSDEYKQMLKETGAEIVLKDKPNNFKVMSTYSIKPEKKRGASTKKKKKK